MKLTQIIRLLFKPVYYFIADILGCFYALFNFGKLKDEKKYTVIGDSHTSFFAGYNFPQSIPLFNRENVFLKKTFVDVRASAKNK